ncbi:MAG: tetratricopeptide repeat protein, partial [Bacteroidetes bacterium]|nr:tetratricopeptide repeat protein [Bacteroidota bacterium]
MSDTPEARHAEGLRHSAPAASQAEALNVLGLRAVQRGETKEAAELFRKSVVIDPAYADAYFNLGKALKELCAFPEAVEALRHVVALQPADADAWYNLGNACNALGNLEEAEQCFRTGIRLKPDDVRMYNNLAVTLQALGHLDDATAVTSVGLAIDPSYPDLHYNRSLILLLKGAFSEGWAEFEWRFATTDRANPLRESTIPRWDGKSVFGKTILLSAEQGLGDTIQFVRFARQLHDRGARVLVECPPELCSLVRSAPGVDTVIARGETLPPHEIWTSLLSVPHLARIMDQGSYGLAVPYVFPESSKVDAWKDRIQAHGRGMRIGVVWAGNPRHKNDHNRSCPPVWFERLLHTPNTVWVSLQTGLTDMPDIVRNGHLIDFTRHMTDFSESAALISTLDLVITVDTAVAHLAGAMGKHVWVLLPFAPDWRWMLARNDSPWYPSMRIFRQRRRGEWGSVFDEVETALNGVAAKFTPPARRADTIRPFRFSRSRRAVPQSPRMHQTMTHDFAALMAYGDALSSSGLKEHAIDVYRRILHQQPGLSPAWNNLGVCLQQQGDLPEAIQAFDRAAELDPRNAAIACNLGSALYEQNQLSRAEEALRRAIALDSSLPDAHNNLANVLRARGDYEGAKSSYDMAIALRPDFPEPHWNIAQLLLQEGEYVRGWEEYEWRWRRADFTSPVRPFAQPRWEGENSDGKTILIHAEQGFGDTIQFVRFVPEVLKTGARVVLECQRELIRLLRHVEGVSAVVPHGAALPSFDVHVPMMSLPRIFRTTLATIPCAVPYLAPETDDVRQWTRRLRGSGLQVGVVWSGKNHLPSLRKRSCPLASLMPLLGISGTSVWSLQMGDAVQDLQTVPAALRPGDLSPQICDFGDTAAALSVLDLVITIDTSVAHLA